MLKTGLVSVTFRKQSPQEIISLAKKCDLDGIEWGGDIHVPHGDFECAKEVHALMEEANLKTYAYGSYYRVGVTEANEFLDVLLTAQFLHTSTIRVWAGNVGSSEATKVVWDQVIHDSIRIAKLAEGYNIDIAFEYHGNTLTDSISSTLELLKQIHQPNIYSYWQPPVGMSIEERLMGLQLIVPQLKNIHVFQWNQHDRLPLSIGKTEWQTYLKQVPLDDQDHYCSLEFVKDDSIEQFQEDAEVLKSLVAYRNHLK